MFEAPKPIRQSSEALSKTTFIHTSELTSAHRLADHPEEEIIEILQHGTDEILVILKNPERTSLTLPTDRPIEIIEPSDSE